ncbi:transposase (plasmid) [Streptomyces sp. BHT-5-2]|nr:transposase [Streptomyces sp. BHT-5-2]
MAPVARGPPRQAAQRERSGLLPGGRRRLPHPGVKGGSKTGRGPVDRGRRGSQHHLPTDATGIPLAAPLTGGNRNDVTQLIPLLEAVAPSTAPVWAPNAGSRNGRSPTCTGSAACGSTGGSVTTSTKLS